MKRYTLALLLSSSVAMAGDPIESAKGGAEIAPATPWEWFAGVSGGYLLDNESGMVHGHLGADLPWNFAGFNQALFLEVGWTEIDDDFQIDRYDNDSAKSRNKGIRTMFSSVDTDLEIIPITLNWKLEKEFAPSLSFYAGAGAGAAIVDVDVSGGLNGSDDDVVFFGQVFAGLQYHLSESVELYGGVRGIYMDSPDLRVGGVSLGGDVLETDLLLEGGVRVNF